MAGHSRSKRRRRFRSPMPGQPRHCCHRRQTWLPDKPGMTIWRSAPYFAPGSEITRRATSLFQMNSTTSAPIVAVMKPAPWFGP